MARSSLLASCTRRRHDRGRHVDGLAQPRPGHSTAPALAEQPRCDALDDTASFFRGFVEGGSRCARMTFSFPPKRGHHEPSATARWQVLYRIRAPCSQARGSAERQPNHAYGLRFYWLTGKCGRKAGNSASLLLLLLLVPAIVRGRFGCALASLGRWVDGSPRQHAKLGGMYGVRSTASACAGSIGMEQRHGRTVWGTEAIDFSGRARTPAIYPVLRRCPRDPALEEGPWHLHGDVPGFLHEVPASSSTYGRTASGGASPGAGSRHTSTGRILVRRGICRLLCKNRLRWLSVHDAGRWGRYGTHHPLLNRAMSDPWPRCAKS